MIDILIIAAAGLFGLLLTVVVVVWERVDDNARERRRSGWLASFYERPSPRPKP